MPISELLREYQDYVLAHRLRAALGGRLTPKSGLLDVRTYAGKRVERQKLALALVRKEIPLAGLRDIDRLTLDTAYGFWHNPSEVAEFLRGAIRQGGHPALSDPDAFLQLLSPAERERLGEAGRRAVCGHYLTCLSLASPGIDPVVLESIYARVESFKVPAFIDELQGEGLASSA